MRLELRDLELNLTINMFFFKLFGDPNNTIKSSTIFRVFDLESSKLKFGDLWRHRDDQFEYI